MEGPPGGRALLDFGSLFSEEQAAEAWLETLEQVLTSHPVTIAMTPLPEASGVIAEGE